MGCRNDCYCSETFPQSEITPCEHKCQAEGTYRHHLGLYHVVGNYLNSAKTLSRILFLKKFSARSSPLTTRKNGDSLNRSMYDWDAFNIGLSLILGYKNTAVCACFLLPVLFFKSQMQTHTHTHTAIRHQATKQQNKQLYRLQRVLIFGSFLPLRCVQIK